MKRRELNIPDFIKSIIIILILILCLSGNHLVAQNCSVNPGADSTICSNESFLLNGSYTGSLTDGIVWTQVAGPEVTIIDSTDLNTEITDFIPDTFYTFRLSALCSDDSLVFGDVTMTVLPISVANAGSDTAFCAGIHALNANSPLFVNEIGEWKGSVTGITVDDLNNPYSTITILPSVSGFITLTWTITDTISGCSSFDEVIITVVNKELLVSAGPDEAICLNDSLILSGAMIDTSYDSLLWTTAGTGIFNDPALLNPIYYPSSDDSLSGNVTLTLTAFGITGCADSTSSMVLSITGEPTVSAGPDTLICSSLQNFVLEGNATDFSSLIWKSSGTGTFDENTDLNASYFPSLDDIASGEVELSVTAFGNGTCAPVSDTMLLTIQNGPGVYAGNDASICTGGFYQILDAFNRLII